MAGSGQIRTLGRSRWLRRGRCTGKREHAKTRWEAVELSPRGMEVTSGGEVVVEPEESGWISGGV